ncbi:hypothetical protein M0812_02562 [Anaeramoeba flamelloides]|uniref:Uncharacterized protein n=1 Tax=Anaeramoeba flamelloides TaxID=1746091 RepID=A0AAV7YM62_9EUKA|nr:hypothetical protein M0812_02562 [Anaeramoeba flamelloides]
MNFYLLFLFCLIFTTFTREDNRQQLLNLYELNDLSDDLLLEGKLEVIKNQSDFNEQDVNAAWSELKIFLTLVMGSFLIGCFFSYFPIGSANEKINKASIVSLEKAYFENQNLKKNKNY